MKSIQQWFNEYAESHQNQTNKRIHFICVPLIFYSIYGLLSLVPLPVHENLLISNLGNLALLVVLVFYAQYGIRLLFQMLFFSLIGVGLKIILHHFALPEFYIFISVFVVAWIGQFYGHKIEGKKPSFLKDIQFLMIGPAWVAKEMTSKPNE